jgi:hypothetical protein
MVRCILMRAHLGVRVLVSRVQNFPQFNAEKSLGSLRPGPEQRGQNRSRDRARAVA